MAQPSIPHSKSTLIVCENSFQGVWAASNHTVIEAGDYDTVVERDT